MPPLPRTFVIRAAGAAACLLAVVLGGWAAVRGLDAAPKPQWSVVVLMADTLRADHLGAYGYPRDTSPWLDAFAREEAILFEDASSQAPCTYPSVNSLMTSRDPSEFVGAAEPFMGIPDGVPTLASSLAAAGYDTLAVSASPVVRDTPSKRNPDGGFGAGFRVFDEGCLWRKADCVTRRAIRHLDGIEPPFLLYLHYMDPHAPYRPPIPPAQRRFARRKPDREFVRNGNVVPLEAALYSGGDPPDLTATDLQHFVDLYDESVRFMDSWWARLEAHLRARGLWETSVVLVVADHGEELMERGDIGHCRTLSQRTLHTPLVLRIPGISGGTRIRGVVRNLDVVPTLLDVLGIPTEGRGFEGASLVRVLEAGPERQGEGRLSFAWGGWQQSVRDERHKLILDLKRGERWLYDLEADPAETLDVADRRPEIASELQRAVARRWRERQSTLEENVRLGEAAIERLRALGYLQ